MRKGSPKLWRITLIILGCALVILSRGRSADAQSWMHPPQEDVDQAEEERSVLWEEVLAADEQGYEELVAHAKQLWQGRGKQQRALALEKLKTATETKPERPEAFFWRGQFQYESQDWQACARSFAVVFEMDPSFQPKETRIRTNLDFNLAHCLLRAGQYEGAVTHFKRIMSLSSGSVTVELRLGEALMALGRLDEAIDALSRSAGRSSRLEADYAHAVALDRAERISESKAILHKATARDPSLTVLHSTDKVYVPAEDEHYYLGLAYASMDRRTRALYHLRRYLSLAPDSPWAQRARAHRDALGSPALAETIAFSGSALWDSQALQKAVRKEESGLRACLAGQPMVLAQLSLLAVAGGEGKELSVHAKIEAQADAEKEQLEAAISCLESAARKIKAPKLKGARGNHIRAQFSLLGEALTSSN